MNTAKNTCLTCSRSLHATANFAPGSKICDDCIKLDRRILVDMAIAVRNREHMADLTAAGRRKTAKQSDYLIQGKRCSHGHHYKPVAEYDKCSTRGDGLQPSCRACNKMRVNLLNAGRLPNGAQSATVNGKQLWHLARDAMRQQSATLEAAVPFDASAPDSGTV